MNIVGQCGGYCTEIDRWTREYKVIFFCGTRATATFKDGASISQRELEKMLEEIILNHTCSGRPTGVLLQTLPDVR